MNTIQIRTAGDIAVGGMRAEAMRMRAIANNIANANTTRTPAGTPYRRMDVVISTGGGLTGVRNVQVEPDMTTDFVKLRQPGHPDADANGFVSMPNVQLPTEMMNLVTASRAYQAGAAMLKKHQEVLDVAMELLEVRKDDHGTNRTDLERTTPDGAGGARATDGAAKAAGGAGDMNFGEMLKGALGQADGTQQGAASAVQNLLAGKSDDLLSAVTAMSKADLSFKLLVGVRNKVIEAYKQTMNMQI